ncbi:MAG: Gfo/Idh/MocA family oxidoreductase, partial [Clostridia bacterium]|nr:Gfo/Idh/MocA family oxidoreductase [Clostridia bacterium]
MADKIKLGILGIGNMGSGHAKSIALNNTNAEIELVAVADIKAERRQWAKDTLPESVKIFESAEEMLDSGLIDSCLVAVPHYDHPKYAIECFKRRIHVLVEKPAGV